MSCNASPEVDRLAVEYGIPWRLPSFSSVQQAWFSKSSSMNDTDIIARVVYRLCNLETEDLVDSQ